jgi:hypothetical protein
MIFFSADRDLVEADLPEDDMERVARTHDFSKLSLPLLVASHDKEQFEEFIFREGLMCSEVRRIDTLALDALDRFPANKILLLLPRWQECPNTKRQADHWIFKLDRYTVQLSRPAANDGSPSLEFLMPAALLLWIFGAVFYWLLIR